MSLLAPRWRGQAGRVEVWYATVTTSTGEGLWVHYETVAPEHGEPYAHGWIARFPVAGAPTWERFGPDPAAAPSGGEGVHFVSGDNAVADGLLTGATKSMRWHLGFEQQGAPLYTFPRTAWEREVLPGAQIVPVPSAAVRGWAEQDGERVDIVGRGGVARIYGHGHAKRWGWLHADLGGGDVLEIVAGVSRRPGLSSLPPAPFVQLRAGGRDWPRNPLLAAPLLRAKLGLPTWTVAGTVGRRRLRVEVELPDERSIAVDYTDPDGAGSVCTNSERADAEIVVERWAGRWEKERAWVLDGTAHAEIGTRPEEAT